MRLANSAPMAARGSLSCVCSPHRGSVAMCRSSLASRSAVSVRTCTSSTPDGALTDICIDVTLGAICPLSPSQRVGLIEDVSGPARRSSFPSTISYTVESIISDNVLDRRYYTRIGYNMTYMNTNGISMHIAYLCEIKKKLREDSNIVWLRYRRRIVHTSRPGIRSRPSPSRTPSAHPVSYHSRCRCAA